MEMDNPDGKYLELAEKWMDGTITPEEEMEFSEWYNEDQNRELVLPAAFVSGENKHRQRIWQKVQDLKEQNGRPFIRWRYTGVAASVLLVLASAGTLKWFHDRNVIHQASAATTAGLAIRPVADRATLTLGDGSIVELDALKDGSVKKDVSEDIHKQKAQLIYAPVSVGDKGRDKTQPLYNILTTPRGGLYSVVLPDGTKVWLNASSSLRYPTAFTGKVRQVDLTGEAYFEVAASPTLPFKVVVNGMEVNVLGTHFDVMAYDDEEAIATTLLEGAVRVGFNGQSTSLSPGQQSLLNKSAGDIQVKTVDANESVAWKEGLFEFRSEDIRQVMRNVARWYDVDVEYKGVVSDHFSGEVHRDADVYSLLNTMELTHKVHFQVSGKTIIVSP